MKPTPPSSSARTRETSAAPLWPQMLRAVGLGLRPERVFVAFVAVVIGCAIARIPMPWEESRTLRDLWRLEAWPATIWSADGYWTMPARMVAFIADHPWSSVAVGVPLASVLIVAVATIARITAVEVATGALVPSKRAFGLVAARIGSLAAVFLFPAGIVLASLFVMAGVGVVLLSMGGVNILGALIYGVAVLASIALVLFIAAFGLGLPMLAPAVVCEGTGSGAHGRGDAIDALQRAVAYVLAAPLRFALYASLGLAQLFAVGWVGGWIADAAARLARAASTHWLSEQSLLKLTPTTDEPSLAARVMDFWEWVPGALAAACVLSVFASASTLLYLLLRRLCDGQHEREIWLPSRGPDLDSTVEAVGEGAHSDAG